MAKCLGHKSILGLMKTALGQQPMMCRGCVERFIRKRIRIHECLHNRKRLSHLHTHTHVHVHVLGGVMEQYYEPLSPEYSEMDLNLRTNYMRCRHSGTITHTHLLSAFPLSPSPSQKQKHGTSLNTDPLRPTHTHHLTCKPTKVLVIGLIGASFLVFLHLGLCLFAWVGGHTFGPSPEHTHTPRAMGIVPEKQRIA